MNVFGQMGKDRECKDEIHRGTGEVDRRVEINLLEGGPRIGCLGRFDHLAEWVHSNNLSLLKSLTKKRVIRPQPQPKSIATFGRVEDDA